MRRARVLVGVAWALVLLGGVSAGGWFLLRQRPAGGASGPDPGGWQDILAFDVTDVSREHRGDLGDHTIVVVRYERPIGWEVGVYAYPVTETSENLLFDGEDEHGPQPWQSFAWSQRKKLYPDTRIIGYGTPSRQLRIVLRDCETAKRDGFMVFTAGRIEVSYRP